MAGAGCCDRDQAQANDKAAHQNGVGDGQCTLFAGGWPSGVTEDTVCGADVFFPEAPVIRRSLAFVALPLAVLTAQQGPLAGFDDYVARTMKDWKDPGLSIAIVRNDTIVL